jgi:hypothetical protein
MFQIQNVILQVILNQNKNKPDSHGAYHYVKITKNVRKLPILQYVLEIKTVRLNKDPDMPLK